MLPPAPDLTDGWRIIATDDNTSKLTALTQLLLFIGSLLAG